MKKLFGAKVTKEENATIARIELINRSYIGRDPQNAYNSMVREVVRAIEIHGVLRVSEMLINAFGETTAEMLIEDAT